MADGSSAIKFDKPAGDSQTYVLQTADDFYARARAALEAGDKETAQRMINAALALLGGKMPDTPAEAKRPDSEVTKAIAKLKEGWIEPAEMGKQLEMNISRVHAVLARIRGLKGIKVEKKTINYYRIATE